MGNRTSYKKSRNGKVQESAKYTYNLSNQMVSARLYDGKHFKDVEYTYDADGNRTMQEEIKDDGTRKVELTYDYSVENRLKAVHDKNDLLVAMAYDGDGNRIFQLNYNLHTDDDWKGNSGNGNGNHKDNSGSGNKSGDSGGFNSLLSLITGDDAVEDGSESEVQTAAASDGKGKKSNGNKDKDKGNDGNDKNNGVGNGNSGNSGNNGNGNSGGNGNTSTGGSNGNNGNANGNTNNTGGSQNQSGILFPTDGEVSELESELIGMIKTTGKEKNYELVEYVNDVNREHTEVLMELNINGIIPSLTVKRNKTPLKA